MDRIITPLVWLCILANIACVGQKQQNEVTPSQSLSSPTALIKLEDLNQDSPDEQWELFFQQRGAMKCWQELKQERKSLFIDFIFSFKKPIIPMSDQANQVVAGIIQYLSYHNLELEELNLVGNSCYPNQELTSLSPSIGSLINLQKLNLSHNALSELPSSIGKLVNLRELNLCYNALSEIPDFIGDLVALEELDLEHNILSELPSSIGKLVNLRNFDLSYNKLIKLSPAIGKLVNLRKLNLSYNALSEIPDLITNLAALKALNLGSNTFSEFPSSIGKLVNLQYFDLSYNKLIELSPAAIGKLVNLKGLKLDNNNLIQIPLVLGDLVALKQLYLHDNALSKVPPTIGNLVNLENLNLAYNKLIELPLSMGNLVKLKQLTLNNNNLTFLPASLSQFCQFLTEHWQDLSLSGNPWLEQSQLASIDRTLLITNAAQEVRSLFVMCSKYLLRYLESPNEDEEEGKAKQQLVQILPASLKPHVLQQRVKEACQLIQDQYIIHFKKTYNQNIPFYWDQELYTSKDVEHMLEALKDKELYLVAAAVKPN